ncbi:MAG: hypothetical protein KDB94_13085 [Acidobacteria bacterium]|nr:hypothetical protein [Acidobacteriota bacterium]MCB9378529.1 hypothetical protein [Holophagales bacterium]
MSRFAAFALGLLAAGVAAAAPVRVIQTQTPTAFLAGTLDGVSIDDRGILALAAGSERIAALEEPFAFSLAPLPDGWAVGTGDAGRVVAVDRRGGTRVLFEAENSYVFALAAAPDGTLYVGSSPGGKIHKVSPDGKVRSLFAETGETYIWALAFDSEGVLWAATGTEGRLYRIDAKGKAEVAFDSEETHLRSLLPLPGGDLLIGTATSGLLLRWRHEDRSVRTLYDSSLAEVVALAAGPAGEAYAAVLASEASFLDLAPASKATKSSDSDAKEDDEPQGVVTVEMGGEATIGSRPPGSRSPRSELVRILPSGAVEPFWESADETVFSLLWSGGRLWAGTGVDGKLYSFRGDSAVVEKDLEDRQIVGLLPGEAGPVVLSTNAAALWRFVGGREKRGRYTSATLDAGQAARFGVFRWSGELPDGASARFSFRTGFSSEPDRTWSPWSEPVAGREIPLARLDQGRYLQWRVDLQGGGEAAPTISATEVSYRQINLRPKIERFAALDPGQVLVAAGFNPADQVYEPSSPNRDGIFTRLEPSGGRDDGRLKPLWRKGFRTLRWKASDPNQDELRYRLEVRPEGRSDAWLEIADEIDGEQYGFDATVLPDGRYRFRLTASDALGNVAGEGLERRQESEPVVVDHTPPTLEGVERSGRGARLRVYDAWSPLREAQVSIDGGEWRPLAPADGLLDGQREELVLKEIPEGARYVLVRLADAPFNYATFDLLAELGSR